MNNILTATLERHGIDKHYVDVDMCVTEARGACNFTSGEREECMFGFPKRAVLFSIETLIRHGSDFFKSPEYHIKSYIKQLYTPRETDQFFKCIALVAVWAEDNQTIKETDLQNPQNVSAHIQNIADSFGIPVNHELVEIVRFSLMAYTHFQILFRNESEEYTFSHNLIGEMLGVVLGQHNPRECIKLCGREVLMKRITISKTDIEGLKVSIPEIFYPELCVKFEQKRSFR